MIAATFHGPNYYSPNDDESSIEVFDSLGHAMSALFDRYDKGDRENLPVRYLNGNFGATLFPVVTKGHYLRCYRLDWDLPAQENGPLPEDVVLDVLSAVHYGVADYVLTLTNPFGTESEDTVAVTVSRMMVRP